MTELTGGSHNSDYPYHIPDLYKGFTRTQARPQDGELVTVGPI